MARCCFLNSPSAEIEITGEQRSSVSLLLSLPHIGPPLLTLHLINSLIKLCVTYTAAERHEVLDYVDISLLLLLTTTRSAPSSLSLATRASR